jgi:hypothetical protein
MDLRPDDLHSLIFIFYRGRILFVLKDTFARRNRSSLHSLIRFFFQKMDEAQRLARFWRQEEAPGVADPEKMMI